MALKYNVDNRPNRSYELVEYDESWPEKYQEIRAILEPIFGKNAVRFEHVGSTAIPDMIAKPTIDVSVGVNNLSEVKGLYSIMESMGFVCHGDFTKMGEEYFTKDHDGKRVYNVHVYNKDNLQLLSNISFRDYLITHKDAHEEYKQIKLGLRRNFGEDDYNSYIKHKSILMDNLKQKAVVWAKTNQRT